MWKVMSLAGLYSGSNYVFSRPDIKADQLRLDEVKVAGQANLRQIRMWANELNFSPAKHALHLICDEDSLKEILKVPLSVEHERYHRCTAVKWKKHLSCLRDWNVTEVTERRFLKFLCSYFAIPKDEEVSRTIFNGRWLSDLCHAPPPVNLLDIPQIIGLIAQLFAGKKMYGFVSDIRHWFHQILVSNSLSSLFGLQCGDAFYRYRVLPMGWSYSPYVCQALAWTCLLKALTQCSQVSVEVPRDAMPWYLTLSLVPSKEVVGYLFLYYDNIGCFCTNANVSEEIQRCVRHCFVQTNIEWKNFEAFSDHHLCVDSANFKPFNYLGVEFGRRIAESNQLWKSRCVWRHERKRIENLQPLSVDGKRSPRQLAHYIGKIVWDCLVARRPLCRMSASLAYLRVVAVAARTFGWDTASLEVPDDIQSDLSCHWARFTDKEAWYELLVVRSKTTLVAVDASDWGWGAVVLDGGERILRTISVQWPNGKLKLSHIFLREVIALCRCIETLIADDYRGRFIIAEDNTAALHAANRLYSSNSVANVAFARLAEVLASNSCEITCVGIGTADNCADDPSRGCVVDQKRVSATRDVLLAYLRGQFVGKRGAVKNPATSALTRVRHQEALDDDDHDALAQELLLQFVDETGDASIAAGARERHLEAADDYGIESSTERK
jgi:hypothetical protein